MKRLSMIVLVAITLIGTVAHGQNKVPENGVVVPGQPNVQAVQLLLRGYHGVPDRSTFEQISGAREILTRLATDPLGGFYRERAIVALGHWPDDATLAIYRRSLHDPTVSLSSKHIVVLRGAEVFGEAFMEELSAFANDKDPAARITAVVALSTVGTDAAYARIDALALVERDRAVLSAIQEYGRRLR